MRTFSSCASYYRVDHSPHAMAARDSLLLLSCACRNIGYAQTNNIRLLFSCPAAPSLGGALQNKIHYVKITNKTTSSQQQQQWVMIVVYCCHFLNDEYTRSRRVRCLACNKHSPHCTVQCCTHTSAPASVAYASRLVPCFLFSRVSSVRLNRRTLLFSSLSFDLII